MAVEARHLHLFSPQPLLKSTTTSSSRDFIDGQYMYNAPMGAAFVDAGPAAATGYVVPSESGLTVVAANDLSRKRPRGTTNLENVPPSHVHQQHHQMVQFDRLAVQHDEKVRAEMMERRRFAKQMMAAVEERVSKRLRAKDEEIEQMSKLNWAMEEKIKSLVTENQVWRYLAQTNEAAANALRTNLEQLLLAEQLRAKEPDNNSTAADDAESCCGDNLDDHHDYGTNGAANVAASGDWRKLCRNCCADQPSVLLMPCQHLCLCASCASTTNECPICKCCKTGSVHVNLSQ